MFLSCLPGLVRNIKDYDKLNYWFHFPNLLWQNYKPTSFMASGQVKCIPHSLIWGLVMWFASGQLDISRHYGSRSMHSWAYQFIWCRHCHEKTIFQIVHWFKKSKKCIEQSWTQRVAYPKSAARPPPHRCVSDKYDKYMIVVLGEWVWGYFVKGRSIMRLADDLRWSHGHLIVTFWELPLSKPFVFP